MSEVSLLKEMLYWKNKAGELEEIMVFRKSLIGKKLLFKAKDSTEVKT